MKQAILITAYKNIDQLVTLLDAFDTNFCFYIHIDKKSAIPKKAIEELRLKKNVILVSQKYKINWGGVNHLKAILLLLEHAIKDSEIAYFHLITGQDYPIKRPDAITSFLEQNKGKEYLSFNKLPYDAWPEQGMDRLSRYNFYDVWNGKDGIGKQIILKISALQRELGFKRSFPKDFPPLYGGSTYWTLSKNCIGYVFNYMQEHPKYLKRFNYSFCSEEIFFQTIILNSPLKENVVNDDMRFILWEVKNGSYPANLDETDEEAILTSNALFARKFEFPASQTLFDNLNIKLHKK